MSFIFCWLQCFHHQFIFVFICLRCNIIVTLRKEWLIFQTCVFFPEVYVYIKRCRRFPSGRPWEDQWGVPCSRYVKQIHSLHSTCCISNLKHRGHIMSDQLSACPFFHAIASSFTSWVCVVVFFFFWCRSDPWFLGRFYFLRSFPYHLVTQCAYKDKR